MSKKVELPKEEKIFDAGPILTYKSPLSGSDFKNFEFEEKSLGNLILSLNSGYNIRHAIYCILEKTENSSVWYVFIEPSLPASATIEKINMFDRMFGKNNWVKPETKALTGIVHQELKDHALNRSSQEKIKRLIRKGQYEMGLSCSVEDGKFTVVNRSTMQYSIQKIEELAKYANYYMTGIEFDSKKEEFYGREYTLQFHLGRATETFILKNFIYALNGALNQYLKNTLDIFWINIPLTIEKSWNIGFLEGWEEIRHSKRLLGEALLRTIYISTSLKDEKPGEFWPKERDSEVARKCIRLAVAHGIPLDVDRIPDEFKKKSFLKNSLIQACRKETPDAAALVYDLIEQGADIYARDTEYGDDDDDDSVFYYAEKNSNKEIFKYISTIDNFIKAIKSSDEKGIETYLDPDVIMIDRPIHNGKTALAMAAAYGNLDAVMAVIKVLNANNKDFSSSETGLYLKYRSPLLVAAESGSIGKLIVLFCAGANPEELNLDDIRNEKTGVIEAWSNPELLRTAFLDNLIKYLIDLTELGNNRQEEKGGDLVSFQKLKKAIIHAQKIVKLSNLASECYWKEIDSLTRCALNIESRLALNPKGPYLKIMKGLLNDFRDCIPKQDLIFSSKIKFPEIEVKKADEELFDKEIAELKLQKKTFEKLINNKTYWQKVVFKGATPPLFSKPDPNLVLIRKMQTVPIVSLYYYKNIVQCNRVFWSKKLTKLEEFYAAILKSQSIFELLESKPVQQILQEQATVSDANGTYLTPS